MPSFLSTCSSSTLRPHVLDGKRIPFLAASALVSCLLLTGCGGGNSGPGTSPTPTSGPSASELLAFQSNRTGNYEIFLANGDGSGQVRITDNPALDTDPALSPDRTRIAFRSTRDGTPDIYVMNADGGNVTRLTNDARDDSQPAWSPDGTRLAFRSAAADLSGSNIALLNVATKKRSNLTSDEAGVSDSEPAWHPDATRITYVSTREVGGATPGFTQILSQPLAAKTPTLLVGGPAFYRSPAWSPDGSRLAFVSDADGSNQLGIARADGSGVEQLTHDTSNNTTPVWSRSGTRLIFSSAPDGNRDLYALTLSSGTLQRLTTSAGVDAAPDAR